MVTLDSEMSTLAAFDDLRRCTAVLTDGTAEEEFLKYVKLQDEYRLQWLNAVQEAQRLQRELDNSLQSMADLETKLFHARKFVEIEKKARKEAEYERDQMEKKISAVADILQNDRHLNEQTRERIAFLNSYTKKRKSNGEDRLGNDINSTGSILSDLSLTTQSEDDFLDVKSPAHQWKRHRPSHSKSSGVYAGGRKSRISSDGKKNRRSSKQFEVIGANDKIIAQTRVSIPPEGQGPIEAESIIEAVPQRNEKENNEPNIMNSPKVFSPPSSTIKKSPKRNYITPTAPPLTDLQNSKAFGTPTINRSVMRNHNFAQKTFIKSDTCNHCQKKIRFGATGWKCQDCRLCVHISCREFLKVTCVPHSATAPGVLGSISDFAPAIPPKIPALIVHCVNEIETRGLTEIGIYRIPGSEREVKQLKERFLRGKSTPNLSNIDIHVLCSCVKDFLRSLKEPLIPTNLWTDFSNAVQNSQTDDDVRHDLYKCLNKLPDANRDTLAFLIMHFQRVAECKECKMPIENIARIFGPTIVGYSKLEPDQHAIFIETMLQYSVMEALLHIPTDYWSQYVSISDSDTIVQLQTPSKSKTKNYQFTTPRTDDSKLTYATTTKKIKRKDRKFYATPPYPGSAKK